MAFGDTNGSTGQKRGTAEVARGSGQCLASGRHHPGKEPREGGTALPTPSISAMSQQIRQGHAAMLRMGQLQPGHGIRMA